MSGRSKGGAARLGSGVPVLKCPRCGSLNLARILYGEPSWAAEADIRAGRIVLGGCDVGAEDPEHRCRKCGTEFGNARLGAAAGRPVRESLTTRLLPAEPRPGTWRVGRLVLTGAAQSSKHPPELRDLLVAAFDELARQDVTVTYLITPAGFFKPKAPPELDPSHGWGTKLGDFKDLRRVAQAFVAEQLDSDTLDRARGHVSYLVLGADVHVPDRGVYAETALVYDVKKASFAGATGKTYPTTGQERKLVRNRDAASHVMDIDGEKVAVLVCHDLIAWSPRGAAARGCRRAEVAADLNDALTDGQPTTVLHLPHTTHSAQTWAQSWSQIDKLLPEATWASAIKYPSAIKHRKGDSRPSAPLGPELLDRTRSRGGGVLDIVLGDHTSL